MDCCPECKNVNVVDAEDKGNKFKWCRNCGWTSDGKETPRFAKGR